MTFLQITLLITCVLDLFFAALVLFTSKRDYHHYALVAFILAIVGWCFSLLLVQIYPQTVVLFNTAFFFGVLMPTLLVVFIGLFVQYFKKWRHIIFLCIPAFLFAVFSYIPNILFQNPHVEGVHIISTHDGIAPLLFNLYVYVYLGLFLYILLRYFWQSQGVQRTKLMYIALGFSLFAIFAACTNVLLPFFGIYSLNGWGPASSLILVSFLVYAVLRYRFLNLRIVVQKSFVYGLSAAFLFWVLYLVVDFLETQFSLPSYGIVGILVVIGFFLFPLFEKIMQYIVGAVFFQDSALDLVSLTSRLDAILHAEMGETQKVLDRFSQEIAEQFSVPLCGMILKTEKDHTYRTFFSITPKKFVYDFVDFQFCSHEVCILEESIAQDKGFSDTLQKLHRDGISLVMRISQKGFYKGFLYLGSREYPWSVEDVQKVREFQQGFQVSLEKALVYDRMMKVLLHHTKNQEICG